MEPFTVQPLLEDWIEPLPFEPQTCRANYAVLLLERQLYYSQGSLQEFTRNIIKCQRTEDFNFVNPLQIQINPGYERCVFNSCLLHRNGTTVDILSTLDFKEIQREKELEYKIYSGLKTYLAHIEGLYKGDIVEYSYTIIHNSPIYKNNFSFMIPLQYPMAVYTLYNKVIYKHEHKKLRAIAVFGGKKENEFTILPQEPFTYKKDTVPALVFEQGMTAEAALPSYLDFSTYESWEAFGDDLFEDYNRPYDDQFDAKTYIQALGNIESREKLIETVVNHLKTNVHYQSICIDEHSYIPHAPDQVVKKNFGDCKDKSLLLKILLESIGERCSVILVHTVLGSMIKNRLISLSCFNHALVKLVRNDKVYYIDPADEYTPFFFETPVERDYSYYFDTTERKLHTMDTVKNCTHTRSVRKTFALSFDHATLTVNDIYQNLEFSRMHFIVLSQTTDALKQQYLDFFKQHYPAIEYSDYDSFQVIAHPEKATITIFARFSIDNIWQQSVQNTKTTYVPFYPFLLNEYISLPEAGTRKTACVWPHPVAFEYSYEVFNYPIKIKDIKEKLENEFFIAEIETQYTNKWTYTISYKSKRAEIPASEFIPMKENVAKLKHSIGRSLSRKKPLFPKKNQGRFSWLAMALIIYLLLQVVLIMLRN